MTWLVWIFCFRAVVPVISESSKIVLSINVMEWERTLSKMAGTGIFAVFQSYNVRGLNECRKT